MGHIWTYDVFLSFRGVDTRKMFTSHLLSAFRREGIYFFKDNGQDEVGRFIGPKLTDAIHHSKTGLILFSRNYAESRWCLNELVEILECNERQKKNEHMVIPIFYHVDPRDVRGLTGEFGDGFAKCKNKHLEDPELVEKWRNALVVAGNLSGWELKHYANGDEAEFVDMILREVRCKIHQPLYNIKDTVGLESIVEDIVSLCNTGSDDVRFIGLYGVQGIGKTLIAKMLHSCIIDKFNGFCFLTFVGDESNEELVLQQKKLLYDILKPREDLVMYGVHTNKAEISMRLWRRKALVILDNVDNRGQVDALAGDRNWFGAGSLILIITRDRALFKDLEVDNKYLVTGLDKKASLQLFYRHAFHGDVPKGGFEELCKSFLHYTGGLPLALKNLGSFLSKKTKKQWHETLEKLHKEPCLDTIGVHCGSVPSLYPYKTFGLYGGVGGRPFDDGIHTGIRKIAIATRSEVWNIVTHYDQNGCVVSSCMHGTPCSGTVSQVKLNYPDEYLTSISGFIREEFSPYVINSLKFTTNKRTYGPFGPEVGSPFSFSANGKIIGLMGRSGTALDSIGAYIAPSSHTYPFQVIGPFGGEAGEFWDDGKYADVRQINVLYNVAIESIAIVYDKHGRTSDFIVHGHSGVQGTAYVVKLDYPCEYLTSISGYMRANAESMLTIQSLTFHSNMETYGPYGEEKGNYFSFPPAGGKIVGFFGSFHAHLESIGAYFEPVSHNYLFKTLGPFGGEGGHAWDDGQHDDVWSITIAWRVVIDSISFQYGDDDGGDPLPLSKHGGFDRNTYTVYLDSPDEYLTSVSGYFGVYEGFTVIQSLIFQSTRRMYGPFGTYGRVSSRYFSLPSNIGKIIGFYGRCGAFLDSIGAYVKPCSKNLYPFKSVGLFGGTEGESWDDGKYTNVRQIDIELGDDDSVIGSISFEYERDGNSIQSPIHGGNHEGKKHRIRLENGEYLTSFSGHIEDNSDHIHIQSLTFQSNESTYGPFGVEKGKYFSSPITGGKINGFYGWSSNDQLNAIGAYFEPISLLYPLRMVGPFGGKGGDFWHQKGATGVMKVKIFSGDTINYIAIEHDVDGNPISSHSHGGAGGGEVHWISLDYPGEYLTSISGYISNESGLAFVQSLTFQSNLKRYGPYGKEEGKYFWYPSTGTRIIGFYGRAGEKLDAIGVYAEPIPHLYPLNNVGPFGGKGGTSWNDGVYTDVRAVVISVGYVVSSICFEYDNNGTPIQCSQHGRESLGDKVYKVTLDFPKEYLTSVSGYIRDDSNLVVIQSLTFQSNKGKYGPYGIEKGKGFSFEGRIIGFYGTSGLFLDSMGAYLEPY